LKKPISVDSFQPFPGDNLNIKIHGSLAAVNLAKEKPHYFS